MNNLLQKNGKRQKKIKNFSISSEHMQCKSHKNQLISDQHVTTRVVPEYLTNLSTTQIFLTPPLSLTLAMQISNKKPIKCLTG